MKIDPYLTFPGTCEQAMHFYAQVLGGQIVMLTRFANTPGCEGLPPDGIMHARLVIGDQVLMASDNHPAHPYDGIKGCSISINVDTVEEAHRVFNALSAGGKPIMPLDETFWAQRFGMFIDRFGVPWMVNCARPGY